MLETEAYLTIVIYDRKSFIVQATGCWLVFIECEIIQLPACLHLSRFQLNRKIFLLRHDTRPNNNRSNNTQHHDPQCNVTHQDDAQYNIKNTALDVDD